MILASYLILQEAVCSSKGERTTPSMASLVLAPYNTHGSHLQRRNSGHEMYVTCSKERCRSCLKELLFESEAELGVCRSIKQRKYYHFCWDLP